MIFTAMNLLYFLSSLQQIKPAFVIPDKVTCVVIRYHSRRITCLEFIQQAIISFYLEIRSVSPALYVIAWFKFYVV